jgi:hypothetical protein
LRFQLQKFASDRLRLEGAFLFENSLWPPVTKLPHRPKIHENTSFLARHVRLTLIQSFEIDETIVLFLYGDD